MAIGVGAEAYERLFGPRPPRPAKGHAVDMDVCFDDLDVLQPHPVYAWMGWVQILSPSQASMTTINPLLEIAYARAAAAFAKKTAGR